MCGITGYFDYKSLDLMIDRDHLDSMTDALAHRGPDGRGVFQAPGIGLGHRRLAIIDVKESANQPMATHDGAIHIVFNGEIYNYRELRKQLEHFGQRFSTQSDTEVLLYAYVQWGLQCVDKLNGIFAFAIWDSRVKRLWLVRDPLGVKPLLFSDYQGKISFASEMASFFHFPGFSAEYDPMGIDAFFSFGYAPAPLTGLKHVKHILPGQWLLVEDGRIKFHKYWDIDLSATKIQANEEELIAEFDKLLTAAVRRQIVSDVPIGAFLSGGTDSFAVVRALQKANQGKTKAFSIGFSERSFDELPFAKIAAARLNVDLLSQSMDMNSEKLFQNSAKHCLDPLADSSCLPNYLLCEMASKNVKVALGGDGGDELLGGYETYLATEYAEYYRMIPEWFRRNVIRRLVGFLPESEKRYSFYEKVNRFVYGAEEGKFRDHASWRLISSRELKKAIYTDDLWNQVKNFDPIELYTEPMRRAKNQGCSDLDCLLYADLVFYLPNDMLMKIDRMSMAHGLEVRVPFLDKELVEYVWRLPVRMKIRSRKMRKYILRKVIEKEFPEELKSIPKKGFNVPGHILKQNAKINFDGLMFLNPTVTSKITLDPYQHFSIFIASVFNRHLEGKNAFTH